MPKRSLETLSEPMFYVLMALRRRTLCGVEIVHWIGETTEGRITLGPGTLYTILSKLTDEQVAIYQSQVDECYQEFVNIVADGRDRLRRCIRDADREEENV